MPVVVAIIAVLAIALVAMVVLKRRGVEGPTIAQAPAPKQRVELAPMTGLESALDQALDRSGRNMRDKLASTSGIDELRVADDTGPILRRALDHVEHRSQAASDEPSLDVSERSEQPATAEPGAPGDPAA